MSLSHRIKPVVSNNSFPVAVSMNTPSMVHPNITFGFRMSHSDRWTGSVRIGRYQSVMFVFHDMLFLFLTWVHQKTKLKWPISWKSGYLKQNDALFKRSRRPEWTPNGQNQSLIHKIRHKFVVFAQKHAEFAWFFATFHPNLYQSDYLDTSSGLIVHFYYRNKKIK